MTRCWILVGACVACTPDLPDLDYRGERVRVGSHEEVCAGTLRHLDAELDRIEAELELPRDEGQPFDLYLLDRATLDEVCLEGFSGCAAPDSAYVLSTRFEHSAIHELAHLRVGRTDASGSIALLTEGIAVALEAETICEVDPAWDPPSPSELLPVEWGGDLPGGAYFIGGAWVRWLLDEFGPQDVLSFMAALDDSDSTDTIRSTYSDFFGRSVDDDLYAHWPDKHTETELARLGCVAPELPRDDGTNRLSVSGRLDCGASDVQTDFKRPGWGYIEWTVPVRPDQESQSVRFVGQLPPGTELTLERCACQDATPLEEFEPDPQFDLVWGETMKSPAHRLRWAGPIDRGIEIVGYLDMPCSFDDQDCGQGSKCVSQGECRPLVPDPLGDLEPCTHYSGEPDPCGPKLVCRAIELFADEESYSGLCMTECGVDNACPTGEVCDQGVCTTACDPAASVCVAPLTCREKESGAFCGPVGTAESGESCLWGSECLPGLACVPFEGVEGCELAWLNNGCCAPTCESAADCPLEEPNCIAFGEVSVCSP